MTYEECKSARQLQLFAKKITAPQELLLTVRPVDAVTAECGNRSQCVLAHAIDRQLGLKGHGHIKVDANEASCTVGGFRYVYHVPKPAVKCLKEFDQDGETFGLDFARTKLVAELSKRPKRFKFKLHEIRRITSKTREQQDKENARRRERDAELRIRGEVVPRSSKRYTGV